MSLRQSLNQTVLNQNRCSGQGIHRCSGSQTDLMEQSKSFPRQPAEGLSRNCLPSLNRIALSQNKCSELEGQEEQESHRYSGSQTDLMVRNKSYLWQPAEGLSRSLRQSLNQTVLSQNRCSELEGQELQKSHRYSGSQTDLKEQNKSYLRQPAEGLSRSLRQSLNQTVLSQNRCSELEGQELQESHRCSKNQTVQKEPSTNFQSRPAEDLSKS